MGCAVCGGGGGGWNGCGRRLPDGSIKPPISQIGGGEAEDFLFFSFPRQGQTEGSSVLWHINTLPLHQIHS